MRKSKRYKKIIREKFKKDIYKLSKRNEAVPILIIETCNAKRLRKHISKIWELLNLHHKEALKDYNKKLFGCFPCGEDSVLKSLYFVEPNIYEKYITQLSESCANGDALAVAYKVLDEKEKYIEKTERER